MQKMTDEQVKQEWLADNYELLVKQVGMGLAKSEARKGYLILAKTEVGLDDVTSWALEAMWNAILDWDPNRDVPLRGWIVHQIRNGINDEIKKAIAKKRGYGLERLTLSLIEDYGSDLLPDIDGPGKDWDLDSGGEEKCFGNATSNRRLAAAMPAARAEEDKTQGGIDLQNALAKLPERQREVLRMTADGMPLREIGRELGISHETVNSILKKARARMKELLG